MQKIIVMLFVLATVAGTVNAVVWNAPGPDPANWDIAANWDPVGVPVITDKVQFSRDTAECIIDSAATCFHLVCGDNGPDVVHSLTIAAGGSLVTGNNWSAAGYNRSGIVTVKEGGSLETGNRFGVGWFDPEQGGTPLTPATSYLNVNGGNVLINGDLEIGRTDDKATGLHTGIVNVNSGLLEVTGTIDFRQREISRIDIRYGTMIVNGDITGNIATWSTDDPASVTGFGGLGTVEVVFADGKTTITAAPPNPLDPSPVNETVIAGTFDLSWTNIEPNLPGDSVWVDVWFGRDPEALELVVTIPPTGENTTTAEVTTVDDNESGDVTYFWKVNSYTFGDPGVVDYSSDGEPNYVEGTLFTFDVTGDRSPENVNAGVNMMTWANQSVDLIGTYFDEGPSAVTETWSSSDPSAVFSPSSDGGVTGNAAEATVTVDNAAGAVTLTFTVQDGTNPAVSSDLIVTVYADPCEAARVGDGQAANYPGDFTGPLGVPDCIVDFIDLAEEIAAKWLDDYTLTDPVPKP